MCNHQRWRYKVSRIKKSGLKWLTHNLKVLLLFSYLSSLYLQNIKQIYIADTYWTSALRTMIWTMILPNLLSTLIWRCYLVNLDKIVNVTWPEILVYNLLYNKMKFKNHISKFFKCNSNLVWYIPTNK